MTRLLSARTVAPVAGLLLVLVGATGCASVGAETFDARGEVSLLRADVPLREPTWVSHENVLLTLAADEPRVVKLDPGAETPAGEAQASQPNEGAVLASEELESAGENLATYERKPGQAYLPQPDLGRVAVMDVANLNVEETLELGNAPPYEVATQPNSDTLFTLSRDGSTVTAFDLERDEVVDEVRAEAGEGAMLEAPEKGLYPSFWLADRDGVSFYHGDPAPMRRLTGERIGANDIAVDHESSQRAYVAEAGTGRVVALEGDPEGLLEGELLEVAERDLGEEVRHVETTTTEVYAATENELFVMRREDLSVEETVDFRAPLGDEALKRAPVSGMAVGKEKVYLTLEGQPYVVSVDKP
ncbi:MAG: hypothetical protein M3R38_10660 [Actinomycetota bacterium]|nr:hypothetical protein [Actinomycetota bacterium]